MKVIVLGKDGMLGRYVYTYLKDKFEVIGTTRDTLDAMNWEANDVDSIGINPSDVVINCIGLIPQRNNILKSDFIMVNSLFPVVFYELCSDIGAKLIHVTSDCVYNGTIGGYNEHSLHDAVDTYGRTKSIGEPSGATVIRTSIIGEELKNKLSLLEWLKSNDGGSVNGFTHHYWNGVTCLQFAKVCEQVIEKNMFWKGVKHVTSPRAVSKYELLGVIADSFDLDVSVRHYETDLCDRTLTSIRTDIIFDIPGLYKQLADLRDYTEKLKGDV